MCNDILVAYKNWKSATPAAESAALQLLVKAAMDHGAELSKLYTPAQVRTAVTKGTGNPALGLDVAAAWRVYTFIRPTGPEAVAEATSWIQRLIAFGPQRQQFTAVLDILLSQA